MKPLTAKMLGIDPNTDPNAYAKVRSAWQSLGEPAWERTEQICVMQAVEEDDQYNRIRDTQAFTLHGSGAGVGGAGIDGFGNTVDQGIGAGIGGAGIGGFGSNPVITSVGQIITYTRVWRVSWNFYGDNSFDQARLIRDAMFLDWTAQELSLSNLYLVTDVGRVVYIPELFQGQWFKRSDISMRLNEAVTDTIVVNAIESAEVIGYTNDGEVFDIVVSAQ